MSFFTVRRVGQTPKSPICATISESQSLFEPVRISTSVIVVCLSALRRWQVQAKRCLHKIAIVRVSIKVITARRVVAIVVTGIVASVVMGIFAVVVMSKIESVDYRLFQCRRWALIITLCSNENWKRIHSYKVLAEKK